jgi:hypothetical protein
MIDTNAVAQGFLPVTLRLETGEEILFVLDTGSPLTLLDNSLKGKFGKRIDRYLLRAWEVKQKAGVYVAPRLYMGETALVTGTNVLTCDFKKFLAASDFGRTVRGILGMDCLQNYCIQVDFAAGRMRFLEASAQISEKPGKSFQLNLASTGQERSEFVRTYINHEGLIASEGTNLLVDTGLDLDGGLTPDSLREYSKKSGGEKMDKKPWYFPECVWEGQTYTNLLLNSVPSNVAGEGANVLGLRFLARHLVTLDFPNRMMYLEPQTVGPYIDAGTRRCIELMPVEGKLPEDIEGRINEILERNKPDLWIRWFGGTLNVKIFGDPRSFHYRFGRRSKGGHWKLKKAWSTDSAGHVIEKYPLL